MSPRLTAAIGTPALPVSDEMYMLADGLEPQRMDNETTFFGLLRVRTPQACQETCGPHRSSLP